MFMFEDNMFLFQHDMNLFGNDMFLFGNDRFLFGHDMFLSENNMFLFEIDTERCRKLINRASIHDARKYFCCPSCKLYSQLCLTSVPPKRVV